MKAYAAAGVGNFAAGFDVLGASLAPVDGSLWGDVVEVEAAEATRFSATGPYADRLPSDPADNLVMRTRDLFAQIVPLPPLALTLHKGLPVCSGLGSSAASVAATAAALNAWCGEPLDRGALLDVAGKAEGLASGSVHLDNVAPALLGGLILVTSSGLPRSLPFPADLRIVVASPALALATREARRVLPREIPLSLAVAHAENLAGFVHALHADDRPLLKATLRDLIAEPWRADLVPGFREAQAKAVAAGALGCSLSGSGPAVFAVCEENDAPAVAAALEGFGAVRTCRLDLEGARVL